MRFRLPDDIGIVPHNSSGVYRFSLRFPSDYELGLRDSTPDVAKIRQQLVSTLNAIEAADSGRLVKGALATPDVRPHLQRQYAVEALPVITLGEFFLSEMSPSNCTVNSLSEAANVFRSALDGVVALYVGMTAKQSFKARLIQHMEGKTALKSQMASLGLSWTQLWFDAVTVEKQTTHLIPAFERIVQAAIKPPFCKA